MATLLLALCIREGHGIVNTLFPTDLPTREWVPFDADGYSTPVSGVLHRLATPALDGMALGGIDTGCLDLNTSSLWGYCTIFNTLVERREGHSTCRFS